VTPFLLASSAPARGDGQEPACTGSVDVAVSCAPGRSQRYARLECSGALAARPTPSALYLVGAGAHPIGGDALEVRLALGPDARLEVRSTGASLARRGVGDAASSMRTDVHLADRASLRWLPDPGIAAAGARHKARTRIVLAASSRLQWRDEVVLGRHGEGVPGSWLSHLEILVSRRPLLVAELGLGPAATSWQLPGVLGGARALSALVVVHPPWQVAPPAARVDSSGSARALLLPLAGPAVEAMAWGDDLGSCRLLLSGLLDSLGGDFDSRSLLPAR